MVSNLMHLDVFRHHVVVGLGGAFMSPSVYNDDKRTDILIPCKV